MPVLNNIIPFCSILAMALVQGCMTDPATPTVRLFCDTSNDLYHILAGMGGLKIERYDNAGDLLSDVHCGDAVLVLSDQYPEYRVELPVGFFDTLRAKDIRFYVEYVSAYPGVHHQFETVAPRFERAIVNSYFFSGMPDSLALLGINGLTYVAAAVDKAHIVAGRVAGFDRAEYGLPDNTHPLLFELPGYSGLFATTNLSRFVTGRYAPGREWNGVWIGILQYLVPGIDPEQFRWDPAVKTAFGKAEPLPQHFQVSSIQAGINWYSDARMLVPDDYEGVIDSVFDSRANTGVIPWNKEIPKGDGSNGVFECIFSNIDEQGNQPIGIVRRGDCTAESAMAFALAGKVLAREDFVGTAKNLLDYYLFESPALKGEYGDPAHGAYGLIPWGIQGYAWYRASYGDDNARFLLGALTTAAITGNAGWDEILTRNLLALVRTTGTHGFRGSRIDLPDFQNNGWRFYFERDIVNMAPHFEAYLWACFLWAYEETGDPLFLERTRNAIRTTMDRYTDGWSWTNGIAQEKARILLPLAWLVRVEDTEENRNMLHKAVEGLLRLQDSCGAIREELGILEMGKYPPTRSNAEYGMNEASLIAKNGDPVSDLLYTTNFAFLGLHEAWHVTGNERIKKASDKLAEFLCRIQVDAPHHPEVHGGWMRAFDYGRFEHWGSNSDAGWGAWAIESGWTQGWIVAVLSLRELDTSLWDLSTGSGISSHYARIKKEMIPQGSTN